MILKFRTERALTLIRQKYGKNNYFSNRPFPSSKNAHFQNEAKWKTFLVKMSFICISIKSAFYNNGFALRLALKQKLGGNSKMAYWSLEGCFELLIVIISLKTQDLIVIVCMTICCVPDGFPLTRKFCVLTTVA